MQTPPIGACVQADAASDDDAGVAELGNPPEDLTITGEVLEIKHGDWRCIGLGIPATTGSNRPWRFRISDGERDVWVGLVLPWRKPLVAVGDQVSVTYAEAPPVFGPGSGSLSIRRVDGATLLWYGLRASTDGLQPPGVKVEDSDVACEFDDGCAIEMRRGFELTADGKRVTLGYGEQAEVGPYLALHAGNAHSTQTKTGRCYDYSVARSSLLLVRSDAEALDASDP